MVLNLYSVHISMESEYVIDGTAESLLGFDGSSSYRNEGISYEIKNKNSNVI